MSQYILDTHALLWMQDDSDQLSNRVRKILSDDRSDLYVSIVSFWEITIKESLGKLRLLYSIDELVESCVVNNIFILPIQITTLSRLKELPFIHRDPFDRMITATAVDFGYTLISKDLNLHKYPVSVVW